MGGNEEDEKAARALGNHLRIETTRLHAKFLTVPSSSRSGENGVPRPTPLSCSRRQRRRKTFRYLYDLGEGLGSQRRDLVRQGLTDMPELVVVGRSVQVKENAHRPIPHFLPTAPSRSPDRWHMAVLPGVRRGRQRQPPQRRNLRNSGRQSDQRLQ